MIKTEANRGRTFTRRGLFVGGCKMGMMSVLAGRLYYLQIMRSDEFTTMSEENRIKLQLVAPPRGRMLDRTGLIIAENLENYQLQIDLRFDKDYEAHILRLCTLLNVPQEGLESILKRAQRHRGAAPFLVFEHMNWEDVAKIEINRLDFPSAEIATGQVRHYPLSEHTAHLTGYVGIVSEKEDDKNPLLRLPNFKLGKNGLEKQFEMSLRGKAGIKRLEVNAHGHVVREISKEPSTPGDDLHLSIDARLQEYAVERMGEETGSIVVLDCKTGEVLTYVSLPAYDPNVLSKQIEREYWNELLRDTRAPLLNKGVAGQYPPGSTFKMLVALAALESKVVTPANSFYCPGYVDLGSHRFHCWKREGHGSVDMVGAIAHSCDSYFYQVGQKLGVDRIAEMARKFSLGGLTGVDLPGEKPGLIPDQAWKKRRFKNQPWLTGETFNTAIGQGYVLTTPLQLAVMTAILANGGNRIRPTLLKRSRHAQLSEPLYESIGVDPDNLKVVLDGMNAVTNVPGGTAYGKRIPDEDFQMAGKTGTAQVKRIVRVGSKAQKENRREFKHHAWFVAFAPVHAPRYAACVLVEHGESGSGTAAPIARDILLKAKELDPLGLYPQKE